jgi:menaquinone-specific isochorismate synthase
VTGFIADRGDALWWRAGEGLIGRGRAASVEVAGGATRASDAWPQLRELLVGDRVAFGSLTFDPVSEGSVLFVPEVLERITELPSLRDDNDGERPRFAGARIDEVRWMEEVALAVEAVRSSPLSKVVLARDEVLWSKAPFSEAAVALRLARAFPGCYTFVCDGLVGATPELLVRRSGTQVGSVVLAGSARRGKDEREDVAEAEALFGSEKEREEHSLAVRSVVEALESVCAEVKADPEPHLLQLRNVQHLATKVSAYLDEDEVSVLHLVDALHPTAAVGGVPRDAALERIRSVEGDLRGRYAGPVGWIDGKGDGEWAIALRCALLTGDRARLFAGAGIVEGSLPEAELEETRLKFRAMEDALGL